MEAIAASVIAKGTASGWTLCILVLIGVVILLKILAAQRPKMKEMEIEAREGDFERLRIEIATLKSDHKETLETQNKRISKVEAEAEGARREAVTAKEHAMRSDGKLQSALTACEVLLGLVEREMPDAKEIPLVKRLLAQAATSDMGVGDGIRKLATIRGVGE